MEIETDKKQEQVEFILVNNEEEKEYNGRYFVND